MFIMNPFTGHGLHVELFSSHPPTEERIKALMEMRRAGRSRQTRRRPVHSRGRSLIRVDRVPRTLGAYAFLIQPAIAVEQLRILPFEKREEVLAHAGLRGARRRRRRSRTPASANRAQRPLDDRA